MALVNEQAASNGLPRIGFANPALYAIAEGGNYSQDFHDVTGGDNTSTLSPNRFYATSGYDLCTGWGSPAGQNLIDDLTIQRSSFLVTPAAGFSAVGLVNGSFDVTNQQFIIETSGWLPFHWSLVNTSLWLSASITNGDVSPGFSTPISVSLTSAAYSLPPGEYDATLVFSNWNDGTLQSRSFTLEVDAVGAAQVTINPPAAVSAGAQWQIDGGAWQNSDSTVSRIEVGTHSLSFSNVSGWATPANQTIDIQTNETTNIVANYTEEGSLQVTIGPADPSLAGAEWLLDGIGGWYGNWYASGVTVILPPGQHTVDFSTGAADWISPASETVLVQAGAATSIYASCLPAGWLQVTASPTGAWQLDGGAWRGNGTVLGGVSAGTHTVSFQPQSGLITPPPVTVSISQDQTNFLTATYQLETGSLQVMIYSAQSGLANLQWSVDGGPWQNNGATLSGLAAWTTNSSQHTLTLANSDGLVLGTESVQVFENQTNVITPIIPEPHAFSIIAGYQGGAGSQDGTNNSARFNVPSGIATDTQGDLFVADTGNSTIRELTPMGTNWVVTTIAGQPGIVGSHDDTNTQATFNSPSGIAAGLDGELYVADFGNCTIRELMPSGTNWIVSTIAGLAGNCDTNDGTGGTNGVARFNDPFGLAVGADGSVYVADEANFCIRKLTQVAGVWQVTTIAGQPGAGGYNDGIGAQAHFYYPKAVAVNATGTLYVADTGAGTIRELTLEGSNYMVTTIAGRPPGGPDVDGVGTNSLFLGPEGITVDSSNNLYITEDSGAIRMLTPIGTNWAASTNWLATTISGSAFSWPKTIVVDTNGNIFFALGGDDVIVKGWNWNPPTGSLQVTLMPVEASSAGAAWQADGGPWETNGETVAGLTVGTHVVTFSDVTGLVTPAPQTVTIATNQTATTEGDYTPPFGALQVSLNPSDGAWQVDNGPWQSNGATVLNLSIGQHVVSFLAVSNWATPPDQDVMITGHYQTNEITGNYSPLWDLTVTIDPIGAVQSGAMWAVDNGPWQTNGATVTSTALYGLFGLYGWHAVTFLPVDGWSTPGYQWIELSGGQTSTVTGTYQQEGSLQVTMPAGAADAGALWEADSGPWLTNGATVVLVAGNHTLYFSGVGGWVTPTNENVYIPPAQLTNVIATYTQLYGAVSVNLLPKAAAAAGAQWHVDSGAWQNSGAIVPILPGSCVVSFKTLTNWQTPSNQIVNVNYSATNLLTGGYTLIESVPPTLTILTPSTNRPWAYPSLTVVGTAQDNVGIGSVYYRLNNGAWLAANGTTNWAATVLLPPGSNIVSAFAVDVNGNRSKTNSITAPYLSGSRLTIDIVGSGKVTPNLSGELLSLGQPYTVTASPAKGSVFSNWTGGVNYDLPSLTFVMQSNLFLQANFTASPFKSLAGKYTGLALETNGVPGTNSGQFTASLNSSGGFTAQLRSSTLKLSFAGQFTALGLWSNAAPQSHAPPIPESLQIDTSGSGTMIGQIGSGISNQYVLAKRSSFSANNPAEEAGKYTLLFSSSTNASLAGGFGTVSIDTLGNAHYTGQMFDRSKITQGSIISDFGEWPFYAPLHGTDYLAGWIVFTNSPNTNLVGQVFWVRPGESAASNPTGFFTPMNVIGSRTGSTNGVHPAEQRQPIP